MSYNAATLFDDASPNGDEYLLLDDLVTLVALGLVAFVLRRAGDSATQIARTMTGS
jgi:hypothetical protein